MRAETFHGLYDRHGKFFAVLVYLDFGHNDPTKPVFLLDKKSLCG
jgi:hypothetical protein